MHIQPECLVCLYRQALRAGRLLELEDEPLKTVMDAAAKTLIEHDLTATAPQIAKPIYAQIRAVTGCEDPLARVKQRAIEQVGQIDLSPYQTLDQALQLSVIGNVIDFGAAEQLDLEHMLRRAFDVPFAIDESAALKADLARAQSFVLIGDNVGEHLLDRHLLQIIARDYPHIKRYFFVRGAPVINDVTVKEAQALEAVAEVVDTGVGTPGFDLQEANAYSRGIFDAADVVLSKGMGNLESLYRQVERQVYYLLVVKCDVMAGRTGQQIQDRLLMKEKASA